MPISILHLLGTAQPEGSGIVRIVAALAAGLDPSKYQVHALFLGPDGPLTDTVQIAGATVSSINWSRGARNPVGAYRFLRFLHAHDFAIVHQHFGARSVRQIVRFSSDARLIVHVHGRVTESISARSTPVAIRGADVVIAVSHAVASQLPALRPIVVYSGVESPKEFQPDNKPARKTTIIGAACRLVPLKGLMQLIQAVASLGPEFPTLRLEIAGSGPQHEKLEREVDRLSLASQVRFLGWQTDLRPIIRGWDIFAMPSLDEGLPVAIIEAMAEGLPVVATSVGGMPELVEEGLTGFLVPPSDVTALANRLRLLILNPTRANAMGAAGRQRANEHFSVDRMVQQVAGIYDSLILQQKGVKEVASRPVTI